MKLLASIAIMLLIGGCSTNKSVSEDAFKVMCNNYNLAICGDIQGDEYSYSSMRDVVDYSYDLFNNNYIYTPDKSSDGVDYYDYMAGTPMRGDCDDVVITLLEDLIVLGLIDDGEAEWAFGTRNGNRHHWLLVTKGGLTLLFDTYHLYGKNLQSLDEYEKEFTVYRY